MNFGLDPVYYEFRIIIIIIIIINGGIYICNGAHTLYSKCAVIIYSGL